MRAHWMLLGVWVGLASVASAQTQGPDVVALVREDIQTGTPADLAQFLADDVDLTLDGELVRCSKNQAEVVLREYLRHHPLGPARVVREASPTDSLRYIVARAKNPSGPPVRLELVLRKENGHFSINAMNMVPE